MWWSNSKRWSKTLNFNTYWKNNLENNKQGCFWKKLVFTPCLFDQSFVSLKAEFRNKIRSDYQQLYHSAFIIQHSAF